MTNVMRPTWAWKPHPIILAVDDVFFIQGNALCCQTNNLLTVGPSLEEEDECATEIQSSHPFKCQAAECRRTFGTVTQYELHYNTAHRHPCLECHRSFPTNHLLDIHLTEWHDPLFDLQNQKQNMYCCLLETCKEKLSNHHTRRDHMIKVHKYPAKFRFEKPSKDKVQSAHRQKRALQKDESEYAMDTGSNTTLNTPSALALLACPWIAAQSNSQQQSTVKHKPLLEICPSNKERFTGNTAAHSTLGESMAQGSEVQVGNDEDIETESIANDISNVPESRPARRFNYRASVPKTICFGAGSQRGFHGARGQRGRRGGKHWHQTTASLTMDTTVDIDQVNMSDLSEALDT